MKKNLLFVILAFSMNAFAQTPDWQWAKLINDTTIQADTYDSEITLDKDGNVYTAGYFARTVDFDPGEGIFKLTSAGGKDIFITKTDAFGNFIWAERMGGTNNDAPYAITVDGLGNVYTTGYFTGTADFDPGKETFNLTSAGTYNAFISKLDKDGNFLWAKSMGGATNDVSAVGYCIALDTAGNVFIAGSFYGTVDFNPGTEIFNISSVGLGSDIFISKLDTEGNFVWAETIDGNNDFTNALAIDMLGNVYTAFQLHGTIDFDPGTGIFNLTAPVGNPSGVISKLDASGNFLWAKQIDYTEISSLTIDASNNIYSTGYYSGTVDFDPDEGVSNLVSAGSSDIFISKLDSSGDFVFAKGMGGISSDHGTSIALDNDGNIYISGDFSGTADFDPGTGSFNLSSNGSSDIFVSKLDNLGNFVWAKSAGGIEYDWCSFNSIHADALGNIYLSGGFTSPSISFGTNSLLNAGNTGTAEIFIAQLGDKTTGIERVVKNDDTFSVFPNPTNGKITINSTSNISSVEIYNLPGSRIYSDIKPAQQTSCEIDLAGQPKGIYLLKVKSGIGNNIRKIVLQ